MRETFILFGFLVLSFYASQYVAAAPISAADKKPFSDVWPCGDKRFTAIEQRAAAAAKAYLERERKKPLDGRYRVSQTQEGYTVFVMYVGSYDQDGRPVYAPGGYGIVYLNADFTFHRHMPGM